MRERDEGKDDMRERERGKGEMRERKEAREIRGRGREGRI